MKVYIISDRPINELFPPETSLTQKGKWTNLSGVLPFDHDFTGPFECEQSCSNEEMSEARNRMLAILRADVVFIHCGTLVHRKEYADIAYAYAIKKHLVVGLWDERALRVNPLLSEVVPEVFRVGEHVRSSYLQLMPSVTPDASEEFVLLSSKFGGLCKSCGGSYQKNDPIMWSRKHGAWHTHCHEVKFGDGPKQATFSAEFVDSLQKKCVDLEYENTALMAKCASIEQALFEQNCSLLEGG